MGFIIKLIRKTAFFEPFLKLAQHTELSSLTYNCYV